MKNIKDPLPSFEEFDKNFNPPEEKPSPLQKFRNSCIAILFGVFFFHILFYGSMIFVRAAPGEAFYWFKNPFFLVYLGICALLGWWRGQKFTRWLYEEIGYLKFW
ncbi:MAG: hypothetical protein GVY07_15355 [Bacteroidetes bacterium]|nr:hypothetical protein [Bacteroidota bacterium]